MEVSVGVRAEGTGYSPPRMSPAFGSSLISLREAPDAHGTMRSSLHFQPGVGSVWVKRRLWAHSGHRLRRQRVFAAIRCLILRTKNSRPGRNVSQMLCGLSISKKSVKHVLPELWIEHQHVTATNRLEAPPAARPDK